MKIQVIKVQTPAFPLEKIPINQPDKDHHSLLPSAGTLTMKNKEYIDSKEGNFVEQNTTRVASPPEELPFEVELPENSPRRNNIPEETPGKEVKHPDDEEPAENIPYEEVMPEDAPPRKNVPEKTLS